MYKLQVVFVSLNQVLKFDGVEADEQEFESPTLTSVCVTEEICLTRFLTGKVIALFIFNLTYL
jgi:hypothetical protein